MAPIYMKAVNIWTARCIPPVLAGIICYTTYVHVARLCVVYLLQDRARGRRAGVAAALLAVYSVLLLLMVAAYLRLLYIVILHPGYVPRRPRADARLSGTVDGRANPDESGLEEFYTKDAFVCEYDGRPNWCSECQNWKPDRTHHCSDVGRCVKRMDHFCPWVGGVVGENSFKFFIQFVTYTFIYCAFLIVVMAYYLHEQLSTPDFTYDPQLAAVLGLATFFGLFTFGMSVNSIRLALSNLTTIENLNKKTKVWQLAVYISDRVTPPTRTAIGNPFRTVTYPLPLSPEKASTDSDPSVSTNGQVIQSQSNRSDLEHHAERDAKAKRTFGILTMEPGANPWDLGALGNWKSVMGNSLFDWFLPIRRSPLCNHESDIGQFAFGACLEKLKADNELIPKHGTRRANPPSGRKSKRRSGRVSQDIKLQKYHQPP